MNAFTVSALLALGGGAFVYKVTMKQTLRVKTAVILAIVSAFFLFLVGMLSLSSFLK